MSDNIVFLRNDPTQVAAGLLAERIKELVYDQAGRMSLATAIGVLEIVKQELVMDAYDD